MMNNLTIEFKLKNISKNNRFREHVKELESEISNLIFLSNEFVGTSLGNQYRENASSIQKKLNLAKDESQRLIV